MLEDTEGYKVRRRVMNASRIRRLGQGLVALFKKFVDGKIESI